jgi:hypothetical protein
VWAGAASEVWAATNVHLAFRRQTREASLDFRRTIVLLLLCSLVSCALLAQGEAVNARLSGIVFDPGDAVVAGAAVTLSSAATGFTRQLTTSTDGQFAFALIPPGPYELRVEMPGFSTYLQTNIVLAVGQSSHVNPKLELGRIDQIIEVTADSPILNTGNANIGSEVSGKQVVELPLNLRNVFSLVMLSSSVNNGIEYQGLT